MLGFLREDENLQKSVEISGNLRLGSVCPLSFVPLSAPWLLPKFMSISFSSVYLILEVCQQRGMGIRRCWQFPISFYRLGLRFWGVSDKVAHFCCCRVCIKTPLLTCSRCQFLCWTDLQDKPTDDDHHQLHLASCQISRCLHQASSRELPLKTPKKHIPTTETWSFHVQAQALSRKHGGLSSHMCHCSPTNKAI